MIPFINKCAFIYQHWSHTSIIFIPQIYISGKTRISTHWANIVMPEILNSTKLSPGTESRKVRVLIKSRVSKQLLSHFVHIVEVSWVEVRSTNRNLSKKRAHLQFGYGPNYQHKIKHPNKWTATRTNNTTVIVSGCQRLSAADGRWFKPTTSSSSSRCSAPTIPEVWKEVDSRAGHGGWVGRGRSSSNGHVVRRAPVSSPLLCSGTEIKHVTWAKR